MLVEPDLSGFDAKLAAGLAGLHPVVDVAVQPDLSGFEAKLEAALAASRLAAGGGIEIPLRLGLAGSTLADISADLMQQTQLLRQADVYAGILQRDMADASADLMMQTGLLGEVRDLLAQNAALAGAYSGRLGDAAAATVATGAAARAAGGGFAFWGLTLGGWLTTIHLGMVTLGAQVAADAIGITAFGVAATHAIGPAVGAVNNLTTAYSGLDNYQKAAALSLRSFLDGLHQTNEAGIFGVFYQGLNLVQTAMGHTGGIVSQSTKAFSDFAAMLAADFGSPAWAGMLGRGASIIRTDLDALFNLINHGINLIPALFHNFNSLGLGVLHVASGFLGAVRATAEWNSGLTKAVALATAGYGAYRIFWAGLGAGPGILQRVAIGARGAAIATTAFGMNLQAEGAAAAYAAAGTTAVALTFGAAALAAGVLIFHYGNLKTSTDNLIGTLTAQDNAVGNNAAAYRQLANQLGYYQDHITKATGQLHGIYGAITTVSNAQHTLTQAQAAANQSAQNITANAGKFGTVLGLTRSKVVAFANATGIDLTRALKASDAQFGTDVFKLRGYAQAVALSHNPLSQLKVDAQQASSASNSLVQQIQALGAALSGPLMLGSLQNTILATGQFDSGLRTLRTDMQASGGAATLFGGKAGAAGQQMATVVNQAISLSNAIKTSTGSTQQAIAPLSRMISYLEGLHSKSALVRQEIRALQQAISALHSKSITIGVNVIQSGGISVPVGTAGGGIPVIKTATGGVVPGYAPGQDTVSAMLSPGEGVLVPEAVRALGGPGAISAINRMFGGPRVSRGSKTGMFAGGGIAMSHQFRFPQDIFNINLRADTNIGAQNMRQYASGVTSGLASSFSSLSAIASGAPAGPLGQPAAVTGQFLRTQLAAKLATLRKFFAVIGTLRNRHVDRSLIAQVISLGPDQGLQYASAILSGGGHLIAQLNAEEAQIGRYEKWIGRRAAEVQFGTPISKGFALALKSHEVEAELQKFGRKIAREIARELGVPLGDVPGLAPHHRDHHGPGDHHGRNAAATVNQYFVGTQRPTHEQMAAIKREMGLALAGSW